MQQFGAITNGLEDDKRGTTLQEARDLVAKAALIEPFFQDFVKTIANKLNVRSEDIKFGSIKTAGNIANKAIHEKNGDIRQVKDILRATIEVSKIDQISKAENLLALMDQGALRCLTDIKVNKDSIKNTFNDASFDGFKMLKANFSIQGFSATEIQLSLPCDSKEMKRSHAAYEIKRACDHAFGSFEKLSSRLTEQEKADLSLYLDKKGRRAGKEREKHNQLALGS